MIRKQKKFVLIFVLDFTGWGGILKGNKSIIIEEG